MGSFEMAGRPKNGELNKSAAIRDYFSEYPDAKAKDVIDALGKRGVEVSQALVAGVRSRSQGRPGNKKRRAGSDVTLAEAMVLRKFISQSGLDVSVASKILMDFASLIGKFGGIDRFKEVLGQYEQFESEMNVVCVSESESDEDEDDY
jgi:hypothetical protein